MPVCKHDISINGRKLWLCVSYGEAVGQKKWAETHVSGGGNQYRTNVNSTVHENLEYWIREKDGHEQHIHLRNVGFSVRSGQKVWAAWGAGHGVEEGDFLRFGSIESKADFTMPERNLVRWWQHKIMGRSSAKKLILKHFLAIVLLGGLLISMTGVYRHDFHTYFGQFMASAFFSTIMIAWWLCLITGGIAWNVAASGELQAAMKSINQTIDDLVSEEAAAYASQSGNESEEKSPSPVAA